MKKLLILLLLIPSLCLAWGTFVFQDAGSGAGGGAPTSPDIWEDFTSYSTSTEHTSGGTWAYLGTSSNFTVDTTNDELDTDTNSGVIIHQTSIVNDDGIMCWLWSTNSDYTGVYFRSNNALDRATDGLAWRNDSSSAYALRYCSGANGASCTTIASNIHTNYNITSGHWSCMAWEGTTDNNDGTYSAGEFRVQLWDNGTTDPDTNDDDILSDSEITSLGTPDIALCDSTTTCGVSAVDDVDIGGATIVDTGGYFGVYQGDTTVGSFGEFLAREYP